MSDSYQDFFKKAKQNSNTKPVKIALQTHLKSNKNISNHLKDKKKLISKKMLFFTSISFFITLAAFMFVDDLDHFISKIEISFFPSAKAVEGEAKANSPTNSASGANAPGSTNSANEANAKSSNEGVTTTDAAVKAQQDNAGELNHFARLGERKLELDQREKEIQKMEAELSKQKEELEKKMVELEEVRKKISSVLEEKVQIDDKRIENLVQFYSSMKPQQAAKIIESIDESLAVEVLARMKKKSAADIMNLLKPEKSQIISEKYVGYRK